MTDILLIIIAAAVLLNTVVSVRLMYSFRAFFDTLSRMMRHSQMRRTEKPE